MVSLLSDNMAEKEKETKEIQLTPKTPLHNLCELRLLWRNKKRRIYRAPNRSLVPLVAGKQGSNTPPIPPLDNATDAPDPPPVTSVAGIQDPNTPPMPPLEDAPPVKRLGLETLMLRLKVPSQVVEKKKGLEDCSGERRLRPAKNEKVRFQVALTEQEVDEDFQKIYDSGLRPRRQPKKVHTELNNRLFPAMMIREISLDKYKVRLPPP